MPRILYTCKHCDKLVEPVREGTNEVVRRRRVLLQCGHTASLGSVQVELDPPQELPEADDADLWDRLTGGR